MPRLLLHFARYGPYHHARLRSAAGALRPYGWEVVGLETAGTDAIYSWDQTRRGVGGPEVITAFPGRVHEEITDAEYLRVFPRLLRQLSPDAVAIAGWGSRDARMALAWCWTNNVPRIAMSETRETDGKRVWWKEWIKRWVIGRFDGALVGGRSHHDYLVRLGMDSRLIRKGYNVVDNGCFALEADRWRRNDIANADDSTRSSDKRNPPYFLSSNRFIERKNVAGLIQAYAIYLRSNVDINQGTVPPWNLVLLGDGVLKHHLIAQCRNFRLRIMESAPWEVSRTAKGEQAASSVVYFPGFRQVEELPRFYAHAGAFVHPAWEEPWGLVINEAMASGLPILSSQNVGAAEELVDDDVNGWTFQTENVQEMADRMVRMAACTNKQIAVMGAESKRILAERGATSQFGHGLADLIRLLQ